MREAGAAREAIALLQVARELSERPEFSDLDRSDVLFRLGCCRYRISSVATAIGLFDEALVLAERSGLPCDLLRARIFAWRSRCRRRQADYEAARRTRSGRSSSRSDGRPARRRGSNFQASLVAEKMGHWVLARQYAQQARAIYQDLNDERNTGRLMLNLGGLQLLLGHPEQAIEHLTASFALAVEAGSQPDAAQALGGLAAVRDTSATTTRPTSMLARHSRSSTGATTSSTRSASRTSCWVARCWSGDASTRRRSASGPRTLRSSRWRPSRTGRGRGVALGDLAERRGDAHAAARLCQVLTLRVVRF